MLRPDKIQVTPKKAGDKLFWDLVLSLLQSFQNRKSSLGETEAASFHNFAEII